MIEQPQTKPQARRIRRAFLTAIFLHFLKPKPYNAQLARCLLKGLSLQESTEIIQLIKYPPTLFNLSHLLEWYAPLFPKKGTAIVETLKIGENKAIIQLFSGFDPSCFHRQTDTLME